MKQVIAQAFALMSTYQLENTPNADDLEMVAQGYLHAFSDGLLNEAQIERRFHIWMNNESRWPTPADIRKMRVSDYVPVSNAGQAPALDTDQKRLPTRSETITAGEFAAEHLRKMREALS